MTWRDFGAVEYLGSIVPDLLVSAFAVLTYLGDTALLFVVLALCYWYGDRRRGAYLLGAALGGMALIVALKGVFALPRPPSEFHAVVQDGYGFPSGHALGSTVVWGLLALELDVGTRRQRTTAAAALIVTISLSRVVIGVHYLADVFVGVVVGLAYLGIATRFARGDPHRAFGLAAIVTATALVTSAASLDAVMALGGVFGGWLAWTLASGRAGAAVGVPAVASALIALGTVGYLAETIALSRPLLLVVGAVVPAGIVLLPTMRERAVERRPDAT